jgi:hypothetical protein
MRSRDAWDKAAECVAKILTTTDPAQRQSLIHMRDGWIETANRLAALEEVAQAMVNSSKRVD